MVGWGVPAKIDILRTTACQTSSATRASFVLLTDTALKTLRLFLGGLMPFHFGCLTWGFGDVQGSKSGRSFHALSNF